MENDWHAGAAQIEAAGPAAALSALPAVSLDLETTGLLPKRDHIVQVGAIAIVDGRVEPEVAFEELVRPPVPIPPSSSGIHGITDESVAIAHPFREVSERMLAFCGTRMLIGYSLEFDLAMLAEEFARIGLRYREPAWLDVRLLAAGIGPRALASLDELAERYEVSKGGRHRALADARMTAEIYTRMLPALREAGIRSYGQARTLQSSVSRSQPGSSAADWRRARESRRARTDEEGLSVAKTAVDGFVFRMRLRDLMQSPAIGMDRERTLQEAAQLMTERRIGSVVVDTGEGHGIVTNADLATQLARHGSGAAGLRLADVCSAPMETMPADAHLYRALARMARTKRRHVGVTDETGALAGMISLKNVLRHRSIATLTLGDRIETATNALELASAQSHLPRTAAGLFDERLDAREVAEIVSLEGRALTRRAAELTSDRMESEGLGPPPAPWCLLVLGSGGRGESMLAPDQDNALVVDDGYAGDLDSPDDWFAVFARHLNDLLDEGGIPFCPGGVMARERTWRRTGREWRDRVDRWIANPEPDNVLNVDIFYDMAPVHGDERLAQRLEKHAWRAASRSPLFAQAMGRNAAQRRVPVGMFGNFRTDSDGRVDLKGGGLLPIVSAARAMALRHGIRARSTRKRLEQAFDAAGASPTDLERLLEAHETLLHRILRQQIADISAGRTKIGNSVDVRSLSRSERRDLADTLRSISVLNDILPTVLGGTGAGGSQ